MKAHSTFAVLLLGIALGAGLIIACSDDSPRDADAAVCDCAAAEPPLAGRIIVVTSNPVAVPAGGQGAAAAGCGAEGTFLSGGCNIGNVADTRVHLIYAGMDRSAAAQPIYTCSWASSSTTGQIGTAEAICLVPAP